MTITITQVRTAAKAGQPMRVMSTFDGDYGYAHRVSSANDWTKGHVEVGFDSGQWVWVDPKHLAAA